MKKYIVSICLGMFLFEVVRCKTENDGGRRRGF